MVLKTDTISVTEASLTHKSGFVNIIGKPNAGKSTLLNALIGEKVAIVNSKIQTTRHRILGILNDENSQIIYSDTPGICTPQYELHRRMMKSVYGSLYDADLFLWIVDINDEDPDFELYNRLKKTNVPIFLLLNKIDTLKTKNQSLDPLILKWNKQIEVNKIIPISALQKKNIDNVKTCVLEKMPIHPAYYEKDILTDKPERFFVTEIIREKILSNYNYEIPYCVEVCVEKFIETDNLIKISTVIYVERQSQKKILIGKNASAIKKVSIEARNEMEAFFNKKIFLEQYVKVEENWRTKGNVLDKFGYH